MKTARLLAALVVAASALAGCAQSGSQSDAVTPTATPANVQPPANPGIRVLEDVDYGAGTPGILLDVCLPDADAAPISAGTDEPDTSQPRPAVLIAHGGSWRQGDKANESWRNVCTWLASEGFVSFSLNYRLAPANPFPAAIEDLRTAVTWIRDDAQVERFDIDPARLGAFGGSAGGNLVSLLAVEGAGELDTASRVAAVVELSAPIDLTTAGFSLGGVVPAFRTVQLEYLGCESYSDCGVAREASPIYAVDGTDPPFFIAHSAGERIPIEQSDAFVAALRGAGVDTAYVEVDGELHSIAMLDDELRERITQWLRTRLAP